MHVDEVHLHEENGGTTWEASCRCYIARKIKCKRVAAGERCDFFWTLSLPIEIYCTRRQISAHPLEYLILSALSYWNLVICCEILSSAVKIRGDSMLEFSALNHAESLNVK